MIKVFFSSKINSNDSKSNQNQLIKTQTNTNLIENAIKSQIPILTKIFNNKQERSLYDNISLGKNLWQKSDKTPIQRDFSWDSVCSTTTSMESRDSIISTTSFKEEKRLRRFFNY